RGLGIYDWAGGAVIAREAGLYVQLPTDRSEPVIIADTAERMEFLRRHA
ncbi:inositol-phosphate phosphatase, partial [Brevibacterium paucivorans]